MNNDDDDRIEDEIMDGSDAMDLSESGDEGNIKTMIVDGDLGEARWEFYNKFLYRSFQDQPDGSRRPDMPTGWYTEPNRADREYQNKYILSFADATVLSFKQTHVDLTKPVLKEALSNECPNEWWFRISSRGCREEFNRVFRSTLQEDSDHASKRTTEQLTNLVFIYFSQKGLIQCRSPHCGRFLGALRRVAPACKWDTLREAVITIVACWSSSASHGHNIKVCRVWDHISVAADEAYKWGNNARDGESNVPTFRDFAEDFPVEACNAHEDIYPYVIKTDTPDSNDEPLIMEIMSLLRWLSAYSKNQHSEVSRRMRAGRDESGFLFGLQRQHDYAGVIQKITELQLKPRFDELCPNRLWNLAVSSSLGCQDMLPILEQLESIDFTTAISPKAHVDCTEQFCVIANEDTTNIRQLHKCVGQDCDSDGHIASFPIHKLDALFQNVSSWVPSAWSLHNLAPTDTVEIVKPGTSYLAISHVWSDGTGVGARKQGEVNRCLVEYWAGIAKTLGCEGIWWDTICVPTEKASRRKALSMMLANFEHSKFLVVHDQRLVNLVYKDNEQAAIALVLSTWFTRGWTAAELWATRENEHSVKVIFKSPDPTKQHKPFLVDLDDMLHNAMATSRMRQFPPSLVHISTSRIIGRLRESIGDLRGVFQILRPRATSWPKDRLVVASLIMQGAGLGTAPSDASIVKDQRTSPVLTRYILTKMKHIPSQAVFHGQMPMRRYGGWSWCPPILFDLDACTFSEPSFESWGGFSGGADVYISKDGIASGRFTIMRVEEADCQHMHPVGSHPAVTATVNHALRTWSNCFILKVGNPVNDISTSPGILVHLIKRNVNKFFPSSLRAQSWSCRFISCVYSPFPRTRRAMIRLCYIGDDVDDNQRPLMLARDEEAAALFDEPEDP